MDVLDEYFERHPESREWVDEKLSGEREGIKVLMRKQDELVRVMNDVANKYVKWSLAKDHFISEVIGYSSDINAKINTGEISISNAISEINNEISSLRKQDDYLSSKKKQQTIVLVRNNHAEALKNKRKDTDKLVVAGIGFISGGLQTLVGFALIETGPLGALTIAHGFNNTVENGYFILYREGYVGPVRFVYRGIAKEIFNINERDADVIYSSVDIALSINSMFGYKFKPDSERLYRYIDAGLLSGLKQQGIKIMSGPELFIEFTGDANTIYGQYRSY